MYKTVGGLQSFALDLRLLNMGDTNSDVMVVDFWANGFGMRVRIALEEKGIKYEYEEEDLRIAQRSQLVVEMNPVRKSVPILIYKGNPVCDSAVILEFIDEMWKEDGSPPLLSEDAYERAVTRFWVHFIDNKVSLTIFFILYYLSIYVEHDIIFSE